MDSPFKDILYTNTVPSDAECQRIRDLLVGPRQQIEDLTDEIIGTQLLLDGLSRQRAALRESVAAHLALVSPVRRLPLDILEEIFIACLPTDHNSVMAESDAPLLLCHICSTWRSLALSTPQLWASLHISTLLSEPRMSSMIDAAYGWLSRSGVAPLSISVSAARIYDSDLTKLLATLQSFSLRWEHIRLRLPGFRYYGLLASLSPGDVPILRSVVLTGPGRGTGNTEWSRLGFLGSRSLHSASISVSDPDPLSLPLRWKGLRRLCLQPNSYITPEQALTILEKCPFLETISTIINGGSAIWQTGPISTSETVYHMEHLRNFSPVWNTRDWDRKCH
ncbi:hypothetical protein B0H11DRAFT_2074381 [Mycena galericulata]|nr:hypothetical protein B0H11DRAFT_2074381 [Mycena galericulata]